MQPVRPCLGDYEAQSVANLMVQPLQRFYTLVSYLKIEFGHQVRLVAPQYIAVYPSFDVQHVRHCMCRFEALSVVILMTQPLQRLSTHLSYLEIEFRRQVRFFAPQ